MALGLDGVKGSYPKAVKEMKNSMEISSREFFGKGVNILKNNAKCRIEQFYHTLNLKTFGQSNFWGKKVYLPQFW